MRRVFDDESTRVETLWWTTAYFDDADRCVGSIEARVLPLVIDGQSHKLTGLRRIAIDASYRGRGLMRDLMEVAIDWCAKQSTGGTLLFTSSPELYGRFGFASVPQYVFVGEPAVPLPVEPSRLLDLSKRDDRALLEHLVTRRTAVSSQVAMDGAPDLVIDNIVAADDLIVAFAQGLNAIIVYETDEDSVTLVDIIAVEIPPVGAILGALNLPVRELRTLFPPDRIGWIGQPQQEDTGLMHRGSLPAAMGQPFMLPPTAEF